MQTIDQDNLVAEITVDDKASDDVKKSNFYNRTVHMKGRVANTFRELYAAQHFGVHKSRLDIDSIARLEQLGIPYFQFHSPRDTNDWKKRNWFRLNFPRGVNVRIVSGEAA